MNLELFGLEGIPIVNKGENIAELILKALKNQGKTLEDKDIVLVAETLVSTFPKTAVIPRRFISSLFEST